jgi:GxxExxY protein
VDPEDQLVHSIVSAARRVHHVLGPGFTEGIYTKALLAELKNNGLQVQREKLIKIWYGSALVGKHFLDLIIADSVIVELKAGRSIVPVHVAQITSYLHATNCHIGILLNFGTTELQWQIVRDEERKS